MPKQVTNGWIAEMSSQLGFKIKGHQPSGIYVHGHLGEVWLNYAGFDESAAAGMFKLPGDPAFLRDLSAALTNLADQIARQS